MSITPWFTSSLHDPLQRAALQRQVAVASTACRLSLADQLPVKLDRRFTHLEWLESSAEGTIDSGILGIGTKSGDIMLYHSELRQAAWPGTHADRRGPIDPVSLTRSVETPTFPYVGGQGAGDAISQMRFVPANGRFTSFSGQFSCDEDLLVLSTAISGRLLLHRLLDGKRESQTKHTPISQLLLSTNNAHDHWMTALNTSVELNLAALATTHGELYLADLRECSAGRIKAFQVFKLHKSKIQDIHFCPQRPYWFALASNDKLATVWDIRAIRESQTYEKPPNHVCDAYAAAFDVRNVLKYEPIAALKHDATVVAAVWDPLVAGRLLTTAPKETCKVFSLFDDKLLLDKKARASELEASSVTVTHPHRHFQHLTNIRAAWHPTLPDTFVIGRYPKSASDRRTIDFYDIKSPDAPSYQLFDASAPGIHSLAVFHPSGDCLASASSSSVFLWKKST